MRQAPAARGRRRSYPTQPVKIIIQAPAGNGPDVLARIIAERLGQLWGQQVLILNRPGAGGLIAAQAAASAQPDGYTLYMPSSSTFLVLPARHAKLPFDLDRDFARIGMVAQAPLVIAAAPSLGINSVPELIARAKERPGDIMYSALGRGTLPHATSELFQRRAGIELRYISYGGTNQALQDVMGGRLGLVFDGFGALAGALETGTVKAPRHDGAGTAATPSSSPDSRRDPSRFRCAELVSDAGARGNPGSYHRQGECRFARCSGAAWSAGTPASHRAHGPPDVPGRSHRVHRQRAEKMAVDPGRDRAGRALMEHA